LETLDFIFALSKLVYLFIFSVDWSSLQATGGALQGSGENDKTGRNISRFPCRKPKQFWDIVTKKHRVQNMDS
jgi:hypothetical protein